MKAIEVYQGSDGDMTKRYYAELEKCGPIGTVAMSLFRAQKCSERAKVYRGGIRGKGRYKDMAYDRKAWSMDNLCKILGEHGATLGISFGWKEDSSTLFGQEASWVLYVDAPTGQCSFHSPSRGSGPGYQGDWDGQKGMTVQRVLDFCESVIRETTTMNSAGVLDGGVILQGRSAWPEAATGQETTSAGSSTASPIPEQGELLGK